MIIFALNFVIQFQVLMISAFLPRSEDAPLTMSQRHWIKKLEANIIINYWFRICLEGKSISIEDVTNIIILYWNIKILRCGWELSHDNTMVERIMVGVDYRGDRSFTKWILADTDPWFEGVHCWRMQIKNPNKGWFSIGVANQDTEDMNEKDYNSK